MPTSSGRARSGSREEASWTSVQAFSDSEVLTAIRKRYPKISNSSPGTRIGRHRDHARRRQLQRTPVPGTADEVGAGAHGQNCDRRCAERCRSPAPHHLHVPEGTRRR